MRMLFRHIRNAVEVTPLRNWSYTIEAHLLEGPQKRLPYDLRGC